MPKFQTRPLVKLAFSLLPALFLGLLLWWLARQEKTTAPDQPGVVQTSATAPSPLVATAPGIGARMDEKDVFTKFEEWAANFAGGEASAGVELARERRAALKTLIISDPKAALDRALPWTLRRRMPHEVADLLEERVSARGEFSVMAGLPLPGTDARPFYQRSFTVNGGRSYDAYVYGRREHVGTKYDFPADGIAVDEALALRERPARSPEPEEPAQPGDVVRVAQDGHEVAANGGVPLVSGGASYRVCCMAHAGAVEQGWVEAEQSTGPWMDPDVAPSVWTEGPKTALVIRVDFPNLPGTPRNTNNQELTVDYVTTEMNGDVANYMRDVSYRKTSYTTATTDVTAVLRMPSNSTFYSGSGGANALRVDALSAATAAGFNVNSYDRQLVAFSSIPFPWAGLGQINGPFTWYNGYLQDLVIIHELGHNLGLPHASLWRGTGGNPVSTTGTLQSYGDPFDCMGNNFNGPVPRMWFNAWYLNRMDWMPNAAVTTVTVPGTYRVYRYDDPDAPLNRRLALRVQKDATRSYWLAYRRQFAGLASGLADISAGAQVSWGFGNTYNDSHLIDCDTPTTNAQDASLNVGSTLIDLDAGISFTVQAAGGTGVDAYLDISVVQTGRIYPLQTQYDVDEAAGTVTVQLARTGTPSQGASVTVTTQNGTAVAPGDYSSVSTTVTWSGTDITPKPVVIPVVADAVKESAESFFVNFEPAPGSGPEVIVVGSPVTVTIREPGMRDNTFAHEEFEEPGSVKNLLAAPDGRVIFTGEATELDDEDVDGLGRLENDGALDATFIQGGGMLPVAGRVVARQPDGKLLFGGNFVVLRDAPANRLARLFADGFSDNTFNIGSGPNEEVRALAVQADGRILVGGRFSVWNGAPRLGLARLLPNGALDTGFMAAALPHISVMEVEALVLQPDGKVLVGGLIHTESTGQIFTGGLSSGVLRLHPDGTLDTSFDIGAGAHLEGNTGTPARVSTLARQGDGKVVVGGAFTGFRGVTARRIARLNTDGTLDTGFQSAMGVNGPNNPVRSVAVQGDGRILLAGEFSQVAGVIRHQLARLLPTGAFDNGFDAAVPLGAANFGNHVIQQPDGRILLATEAAGTDSIWRLFSGQLGRAGVIQFSAGNHQANEGGGVQIEVARVGGSLGAVSVNYATLPGTAGTGDFTPVSGTLDWVDGDTTSKFITVQVSEDAIPEPVEFFTVQLGVPSGGAFLGETALASVAVLDPGASDFARVRFTTDSSHAFEFATTPVLVTVEMTPAKAEAVAVPFTISGTATPGIIGDYEITPSVSPLVFAPGETTKTFSITPKQDKITEIGDETVILDLGFPQGEALLQAPFRHTFTLVDDDTAPDVSSDSNNQIVQAGQLAGPFEGQVSGSAPLSLEWQLNGKKVPGAGQPHLLISAARVQDGGEYRLVASNKITKNIRGQASHLVVVDTRVRTVVVPLGGKAVLLAEAGGNALGFEWRKVDGAFPFSRASTRFDRKLTLSKVELDDSGVYICRVSNSRAATAGGDLFMDAGPVVLKVVDTAPLIGLLENELLPPATVGGTYTYEVPVDPEVRKAPIKWTAAGLPSGLKLDAVTGIISGRPQAPDKNGKPYEVTLTAANNGGKGVRKVRLSVAQMPPGLAGSYTARLERHAAINGGLGGRLDFTVTPTGSLSGVLFLGGTALKFTGVLEVDVNGVALPKVEELRIARPGKPVAPPPLVVGFSIEDNLVKAGTISDGAQTLDFTGWRNVWSLAANRADKFAGPHNFVLEMPSSIPDVPRGYSYGTAQVSATGVVTYTGMTADKEKITGSALLGPDGKLVFHQALYKNTPQGSLNGEMLIEEGALADDPADNLLSGSLSWVRPAMSKPRLYAAGFGPVDLAVLGGRYQAPALPLGLAGPGRVRLVFDHAGLPASREPGITLDVDAKGKLIPPLKADNLAGTTLKITAASGLFSGKFALEDSNPVSPPAVMKRPVSFQGVMVPVSGELRGYGWFILQQLPSILEGTTVKTSPFLSGEVIFEEVPGVTTP
ncbi:MAG TPA: hypothetical protein DIT64_03650 [Verrucomicrobiales bacterium]|nr:hypothetical protein [Verrucomicrobiales bacterium]